jgi:predicted DNA-binding helix-hairpin-helix protein
MKQVHKATFSDHFSLITHHFSLLTSFVSPSCTFVDKNLDNSAQLFYIKGMDNSISRLQALSCQMSLERGEEHCYVTGKDYNFPARPNLTPDTGTRDTQIFVHPAVLPNGQRIKLLKTLLSSACERDCYYCPFRLGRDMRRATFQPEEFARLFMLLAQKGIAEGIFLSSGVIGGGVRTEDKLLDTADILRHKLGFRGYIHLKIMPGAQRDQVYRVMQLADRVSVNLEVPNTARLAKLAPHKQFLSELLQPLKWVDEIRRTQLPPPRPWLDTHSSRPTTHSSLITTPDSRLLPRHSSWPSSVTQFVAGGAGESDLELLTATSYLYRNLHLKRAYFSRFNPVPDTPLENQPPVPPIREHRLYQASFLLRDYDFDLEELPFENDGSLPSQTDPKQAWAQRNLAGRPVEINRAERHELLRVPGIGPKGVDAILKARRQSRLRDLSALRALGVVIKHAAPFLLLDGKQATYQPALL